MKEVLILIFIFTCPTLYGKVLKTSLVFLTSSKRVYRGAETWPKPVIIIGPSFTFYEKISLRGPNINLAFFPNRKNSFSLDLGARLYNDSRPWLDINDHKSDHRNKRDRSLEVYIKTSYKFGWNKKFSLSAFLGREVLEYRGLYSQLGLRAPILPFTSLFLNYSFAEKQTNRYLYGPESVSGKGFLECGVGLLLPMVPWQGFLSLNYRHTQLLQTENQVADFVRGNHKHDILSIRVIYTPF